MPKKYEFETIKKINSKRDYQFHFSGSKTAVNHSLIEILNHSISGDYEWAHALMDVLDDVLDLGISESMTFYPNRDDHSKQREIAIIKRVR